MVEVVKIWEGTRLEGLNYGLPVTFIELGPGPEYTSEGLVREIITLTRCKWVCILGKNTSQVGMGTLAKGLSSVGMRIEVEVGGEARDPGWMHTVDRWLVDYVREPAFNYSALRSQDMVRFRVKGKGDLNLALEGFEELRAFPGTRYIKLHDDKLEKEAFALVRKYDRARLYRGGN